MADALKQLAGLGLVRVAQPGPGGSEPRFVRTILGDQLVDASITGSSPLDERLAELEQLRGDLFATVAHELRTPLTSIRTSVGLLLDPGTRADAEQRHQLLGAIQRNAESLQQLADDVLDLARFRTGHVRLGLRRFDARILVGEVAETLAPSLASRDHRVEVEAPDAPVWVFADHRRLERALLNLLSNAHKFSPNAAAIQLAIGEADGEVTWSVTDAGTGIPVEQQSHLFERFFVGATDRARTGTGLGLPIALAIVQAHEGRIELDSEVGRGSTFRIIVPAAGPRSATR
ncbi:MAG: sensor histidine kinase [Candidatus Limnocylindria bacterium]